jgi:hypothetical protein
MCRRSVVLTAKAVRFLESYEFLLGEMGVGPTKVERIAGQIIGLLWSTVPKGTFQCRPKYVGLDPDRPDHSVYEFAEPFITGRYSCTPNDVCVLILELNMPDVWFDLSQDVCEPRVDAA